MTDSDTANSALLAMLHACWRTQAIYEAVRLGLIDQLAKGAGTSAELAKERALDADATHRLLRALATIGICRQIDPERFELADRGQPLRSDAEPSLRGVAMHWGSRLWKSVGTIGGTLETGVPAMSSGPEDFVALQADPNAAAVFNRAMAEQSERIGVAVAAAYDFTRFQTVMDVGGGYGAILAAVLERYPAVKGWTFDMPAVEQKALEYLAARGLADRAGFLGGSFLENLPAKAECLILKYILHDWDDRNCCAILRSCRGALGAGDTVLIVEQIVPEIIGVEQEAIARGDLIMLTVGGKERTEREYRALLTEADLQVRAIHPVDAGFSIIECAAR